ncbi:MAG: TIGR03013 family PEP-CTERM/XrtA system glycosyltransferase [Alphaproteobacteria bacterium]|nr:TIGR03013 family PEP-CTERM/XrtA system glycosyltransferase [Alphaproteobacteria bacterium]
MWALGFIGRCDSCYFDDVVDLEIYEALLVTGAFLLVVAAAGLYNRDSFLDFRVFAQRFVFASQLVLLPTVAVVGVLRSAADYPFGWYIGILTVAIAVFFLAIFTLRVCLFWYLNVDFLKRRVVILGQGPLADMVSDYVRKEGSSHLRCVGRLAQGQSQASSTISLGNIVARARPFARPAPYAHMAESLHAEEIVVATDDRRGLPVEELLRCRLQGIQVTDYLTFWEREAGQIDIDQVGAGWLAFAEGFRLDLARRAVKRILDIVVSSVFLTLSLPLMLAVAALIKLDSRGPIFFTQDRVGRDGKVFKIFKLRSMRVDAEVDGVPRWATLNDDRTTRIGRFIRKMRIDEFPQVINVLMGDMSFIGPRPERPFFVDQIRKQIPFYDLRHRVRPGITGWAQVNYPYGACIEDSKKKLAYDLYYVKNSDLLLDFAILLQTSRVVVSGNGGR